MGKQNNPNNIHVYSDSTKPFGGTGKGNWCCFTRSLSEITASALKYLQDLGFLPKNTQNTINAALVKKVLGSLLQSDKAKISECQFATAMFYAEKLSNKYE